MFSSTERCLAPALTAALFLCAPGLRAEERPRVVLVTNHEDAAIIPLLRAELDRLGLAVEQVDHGQNEVLPRDLRDATRSTNAVAGFRVLVSARVVEVWIADRVTGKISLREVLPQQGDSRVSEAVVVTRAVELLRASLLELQAPYPPLGEVPPPAALQRLATYPAPPARSGLSLGAGYLSSLSGGSGHRMGSWFGGAGLRFAPLAAVSVGVSGALSTQGPGQDAEGGQVRFSVRWLGVDGRLEQRWLGGWIHTAAGVGLSVFQSRAEGAPVQGYTGTEASSVALAPTLPLAVGVQIAPPLRLDLQAHLAWSLRPFPVRSGGVEEGRFGSPIGALGLALFVAVP